MNPSTRLAAVANEIAFVDEAIRARSKDEEG